MMSQLCLKTTSAHPLYKTSALVVVGWAVSSSCSFSRATYYLCTAYRRITSRIYRLNDLIGRATHSHERITGKNPVLVKAHTRITYLTQPTCQAGNPRIAGQADVSTSETSASTTFSSLRLASSARISSRLKDFFTSMV